MEHLTLKAVTTAETDQGIFEAVISSAAVDREKDIVSPQGMVNALHKWIPTGKNITLAWQHSTAAEDQIGYVDPSTARVVGDEVVATGWIDQTTARGKEAWRLVKSGTLGFSFGYLTQKARPRRGGGRHLDEFDVFEVTATPVPIQNDTRVIGWKAVTESEQREQVAALERELDAEQLPEAASLEPSAPEPPPESLPDPPIVPEPADQRRRAAQHDREGARERRQAEERLLSDVPPAPAPPEPQAPESVTDEPPDPAAQRERAEQVDASAQREADDDRVAGEEKSWTSSAHPRAAAGTSTGGQFIAADSGSTAQQDQQASKGAEKLLGKKLTVANIEAFQRAHHLQVDGKIGTQTAAALLGSTGAEKLKPGRMTTKQREALAKAAAKKALSTEELEQRVKALERSLELAGEDLAGDSPYVLLAVSPEEYEGLTGGELKAVWSAAYINDLPDSAFLYIDSGGSKDSDGKTTPRALRFFPYRDSTGAIDLPHLRNALARIPQSNLDQATKDRLTAKAQKLLEGQKAVEYLERAATDPEDVERAAAQVANLDLAPDVQERLVSDARRQLAVKSKPADVTNGREARAVDPLRERAEAVQLEFASGGVSLHKPPRQKASPKPSPELSLGELRRRSRDEILKALSGVDQT